MSRAGAIFSACLRAHASGVRAADLIDRDLTGPDTTPERVAEALGAYVSNEEATIITFLDHEDVRLALLLLAQFSDLEVE